MTRRGIYPDGLCYQCRRGMCDPGEACPECGTQQPPYRGQVGYPYNAPRAEQEKYRKWRMMLHACGEHRYPRHKAVWARSITAMWAAVGFIVYILWR